MIAALALTAVIAFAAHPEGDDISTGRQWCGLELECKPASFPENVLINYVPSENHSKVARSEVIDLALTERIQLAIYGDATTSGYFTLGPGVWWGWNFYKKIVAAEMSQEHGSHDFAVSCWRLTWVDYFEGEVWNAFLGKVGADSVYCGQIGSYLSFSDFSRDVNSRESGGDSFAVQSQASPDEQHPDAGQERSERSYYQHPSRPKCHLRLSYQVGLGALILVGGLYYACYAYRIDCRVRPETAALYLLFGMCGIGVGIGYILAFGFTF